MAFVPGFKHDVFISYAHADDRPPPEVERGWVSTLVDGLQTGLGWAGLRDHAVWKDQALAGNAELTTQIMEALEQTAALLIVLSPAYVASEWCRREREAFRRLVDTRRTAQRVFVVEMGPVEPEERPVEFGELPGYRFWVRDADRRHPRTLGLPRVESSDKAYWGAMNDLSQDMAGVLERMKVEKSGAAAVAEYAHTVYLAESTDDLDDRRREVRRYLDQLGVRVLPETELPWEPDQYLAAVEAELARSEAFVQLLSEAPGKRGLVRLQHEYAKAAGKPILQWRSPQLEIDAVEQPDHRKLLEGATVRAVGIEEFKRHIVETLERPRETPKPPRSAFVFVDMDSEDRALAEEVCAVLDKAGFAYSLPLSEGDPDEITKDLADNLLECDATIVVYGAASAGWVRRRLRAARRILTERVGALPAFSVFTGPPEEKAPIDFHMPNLDIIDARKGSVAKQVDAFLKSLNPQ